MAPLRAAPFWFHWYERGAVPVALTLNVAVAGAVTVWLCGWTLIEGVTAGDAGGGELPPQPPHPNATKAMTQINEKIRAARLLKASWLDRPPPSLLANFQQAGNGYPTETRRVLFGMALATVAVGRVMVHCVGLYGSQRASLTNLRFKSLSWSCRGRR